MTEYDYKSVPAPARPKKFKGVKEPLERMAMTLSETINAEASGGWDYIGTDSVVMELRKGVMGGTERKAVSFLMFRRARAGEGAGAVQRISPEPRLKAVVDEPLRTDPPIGPAT